MRWCLLAALVAAMSWTASAADERALAQVPAACPVVVQLRGYEGTKDRVFGLVRATLPPRAARFIFELEQNADLARLLGPGRSLAGLAADGPVFVALTQLTEDFAELPYQAAVIARVADYEEFRDGLLTRDERDDLQKRDGYETTRLEGREVYFIKRSDYAVVTFKRATALLFTKPYEGLNTRLSPATAAQLLGADVSVYVDPVAIGKQYGEQLIQARQALAANILAADAFKDKPEFKELMQEVMIKGFTRFLRDTRAFVLTGKIEKDGLAVHVHAEVGKATPSAQFLAASDQATDMAEIGDLPRGFANYSVERHFARAAGNNEFQELQSKIAKIMAGRPAMLESDKKIEEAGRSLTISAHRDRHKTDGIEVNYCRAPQKLVDAMLFTYDTFDAGDFVGSNLILAEKAVVKRNDRQHRGFRLHLVDLTYDLEKSAPAWGVKVDANFVRRQLGGDTGRLWYGTDGKIAVEVRAKKWETAQQYLDRFLDRGTDTLAEHDGYLKARGHLPEKVSTLSLEDTTVATQMMLDAAAQGQFRLFPLRASRPTPGEETYLAMAARFGGDQVALDFWVPSKGFSDYFELVLPAGP